MKTLIALLSAATLAAAAPVFPALEFPQGVGVNIHFTRGHERDLDMIAAGGFKFIRMDFGWGGIERRKGEYDWSAYDELTANLEKRGLRAIYILDYSNGLYEDTIMSVNPLTGREQRDTASPSKPESVAAFAKWAAAAARRYQGKRIVWEIWNEPNISFWKPKPNVKDYITLVLATCKAMRAADPASTIVGPASSEFPWEFLEEMFKAGTLEHLNAVSVHPYRSYSKGPETAAEEYVRLRALIERYAPASKRNMPILSGEWGYATHDKGVTLETQAAFIARQQIANVWQGVPISIWYDWKNDGTQPTYNEHNFGTVSNDLALKPSYVAVQTLTRELNGFRIARRLDASDEAISASVPRGLHERIRNMDPRAGSLGDDFVFLLVNDHGAQKLVAWTSGKPHQVRIDTGLIANTDVAAVDGQGAAIEPKISDGKLSLWLEAAPQYVTVRRPSRALQAAAAWSIDTTVPTSVRAGSKSEFQVPVKIKNPFSTPVQARISLQSPIGQGNKLVVLEPGQTTSETLALRPQRRTSEEIPYVVTVEMADPAVIGRSVERRQLLVANPLMLSAAPVVNGIRLTIASPSGEPFRGSAVVGSKRFAVELKPGQMETFLTVPPSGEHMVSTPVLLVDALGQPAIDPFSIRLQPLSITSGLKAVLEGDAKVPATANIAPADAPRDGERIVGEAYKLDYNFDTGWRFVQVSPGSKPEPISGSPRALGMWIYGDNSGNALRMRVVDSQGQTFQPSGPSLKWTGWRWVEFDVKDFSHAGHWGGPNDGKPRGPLRLDTLLIVDSTRKKTAGTIYLAAPTWVY